MPILLITLYLKRDFQVSLLSEIQIIWEGLNPIIEMITVTLIVPKYYKLDI